MPNKTRHVFCKKGLISSFSYLLNSPTGPPKETTHTQFLFWHREKYVVKKNRVYMETTTNYLAEKLTVKTMKTSLPPRSHAEQATVGGLESNLVKCVNNKPPTKSEICWATIIMTSDCVIVSIKEYFVGNDE